MTWQASRQKFSSTTTYKTSLPTPDAPDTVPQIATFTGHSLHDVEAILDAHYLGRDAKLAEIAIMKRETRTKLLNAL
jgi:hypothetical protein